MDLLRCGENEIQCDNKKCVNKEFHCDGDNDCGDWSDEDTCPMLPGSCSDGEYKYENEFCVSVCDGIQLADYVTLLCCC